MDRLSCPYRAIVWDMLQNTQGIAIGPNLIGLSARLSIWVLQGGKKEVCQTANLISFRKTFIALSDGHLIHSWYSITISPNNVYARRCARKI